MVVPDKPQMTMKYSTCTLHSLITKSTNTHSEYLIIIAFPCEQWLHERASMLCVHMYCLDGKEESQLDASITVY